MVVFSTWWLLKMNKEKLEMFIRKDITLFQENLKLLKEHCLKMYYGMVKLCLLCWARHEANLLRQGHHIKVLGGRFTEFKEKLMLNKHILIIITNLFSLLEDYII
jgi:hypothetical protein